MRIGLSVGKKIGNAVARNKTKRQVRMMVHELFTKEDHNDYILIVRKPYFRMILNRTRNLFKIYI